jgi:hypothetical protein
MEWGTGKGQSYQSHPVYVHVVHYYCLTDSNPEIKEVIFNSGMYKLRAQIKMWCKLTRHKTNGCKLGLGVYVIKFYKLNQQTQCVQYVSSSLLKLTCMKCEILSQCRCKRQQNVPDVCWLRYLKFINIHVYITKVNVTPVVHTH